jgi:arylsulfatase A-like enzyme
MAHRLDGEDVDSDRSTQTEESDEENSGTAGGLLNRRDYVKLSAVTAGASLASSGLGSAVIERHGIQFDRVVNAVDDLGMDPNGNDPIDDALSGAHETGTLIEFPEGDYRVNDELVIGPRSSKSRFGMVGLGDSHTDVQFHFPNADTSGSGFWFVHQKGGGPYYGAPVVRDGEFVREPGYITDVITDEALGFLDAMDEPFYLGVHYTAPHSPWTKDGEAKGQHPEEITRLYDDCPFKSCPQEPMHPGATGLTKRNMGDHESLKGYFAAVTAMDRQIGRIVDRIAELGLREDTLVVFTSDNGFSCGHHGFWGKGNGTFPLNMYENSVKVPFVASHPGRIPQGAVTDAMVNGYDFMPTLLEYLGLPRPGGDQHPGNSYRDVLLGNAEDGRDRVVAHSEYGNVRMIRTERWKYVHRYPHGPHELYDLEEDPDERENLVDDADHRGRVEELRGELADWFGRYVDPQRDGARFPVTGRGQKTRIDDEHVGEGIFHPRED